MGRWLPGATVVNQVTTATDSSSADLVVVTAVNAYIRALAKEPAARREQIQLLSTDVWMACDFADINPGSALAAGMHAAGPGVMDRLFRNFRSGVHGHLIELGGLPNTLRINLL